MPITNTKQTTLQITITSNAEVDGQLHTNDHLGYAGIGGMSYKHSNVNYSEKGCVNSLTHTNDIKSTWALLKRRFTRTYHNISVKHLFCYVNGFSFRPKGRNCMADTIDKMEVLAKKFEGRRVTYKELIK